MSRFSHVTLVIFLSLAVGFNVAHAEYIVGGNLSGTSVSESYSMPTGFLTDSSGLSSFIVTYDSQAGPWIKNVTVNDGMTGSALHYVGENLIVSGAFPWTGWYTEVTTSNWILSSNVSAMSGGFQLPGLVTNLGPDSKSVMLSFDPIYSPSPVVLNFALSWTGAPGTAPAIPVIEFKQYPVSEAQVPEPTSILLLCSGLAGLAGHRRYRR